MAGFNFLPLRGFSPYLYIAIVATILEAFLLRNIGQWNYPLAGEFFTSPFYSEVLERSLHIWDEHFGLGFSNRLNSDGAAQYANGNGGAMHLFGNVLNALFQQIGPSYFINQAVSLFSIILGVYLTLKNFRPHSQNIFITVLLSTAIAVIVHSTDMFTENAASAGRFLVGQGLMLIAFIQCRRLTRLEAGNVYSANNLIPLTLTLSTLLLIFNPYFIALAMMIGLQGVFEFLGGARKRVRIAVDYAKILAIFIVLIFIEYAHVIVPSLLSAGNALMSAGVGRHDSPLGTSWINLVHFYNNPTKDVFGWFGVWLQFGLALLGIIGALLSSGMRRSAIVDLLLILIFLFLAKGSSPPLSEVNHWLHVNVPFLRVMGSGYPYLGAIYTLLIYYLIFGVASSFDALEKRLPRAGVYVAFSLVTAISVVAIFRNDAYLSGNLGARIQPIEYPAEYYEFKKIAEKEMRVGRAYYFPDEGAQIGWDYKFSPAHPLGCCFDLPFSSLFPIDINWSNFNKNSGYYGQTMTFLLHHFHHGDEIARILADADTKYLVFDLSLKQTSAAAVRMLAIRDQIQTSGLFEFRPALSNRYLKVYENKQWQPLLSEPRGITLASDDPNVFLRAARAGASLSKNPVVVSGAITLDDAVKLKESGALKNVLLYNSDEKGLMLDMIRPLHEIKPDANFLSSDGRSWYTYAQTNQVEQTEKYGGRFLGRHTLTSAVAGAKVVYRARTSPDNTNRLLVRALVSPNSGRIGVYANSEKKFLNLHSSGYVGLQWFDLGEVTNSTKRTDIEIESLDTGYSAIVDVVSLVPETQLNESSKIMQNWLTGINVDRVEKTDYLQWKNTYAPVAINLNMAPAQNASQIQPRQITITRQHFNLHDDFNHFGEGDEADDLNLIELAPKANMSSARPAEDKNFLNPRINNRHLASADASAGIYSLKYELSACQPFSELTLSLRTAYVSAALPLHIYASDNASAWTKIATRTSDSEGDQVLDLGSFANGKKRIYLKISYEKLTETPDTVYLTDLIIRGMAGQENMNCELLATAGSNDKYHLHNSKSAVDLSTSNSGERASLKDRSTEKNAIVTNKAFDPNWQVAGARPFNINYGFSAFVTAKEEPFQTPLHGWQDKYRILWLFSLGFYLLLWLTFIWQAFKRERSAIC